MVVVGKGSDGIYFSFDMDCFDLCEVLGVGILVLGGLNYCEVYFVLELLVFMNCIIFMEFVEVNLLFDYNRYIVRLGVEFIVLLLGKCIL